MQEFLAFFLDTLHEDLNRVRKRPKPQTEAEEEEDERQAAAGGEEFASALSWMRHLEQGKSFLVDLLQGQLRSSVTCSRCGHSSRRFEAFLYLSLPVTWQMTTVREALEKYLERETLVGDEQWFCPKCKQKVDATKKIDLWKLPPVLVVHLKRFEFDMHSFRFRKIDSHLRAPELFDLSSLCFSEQKDGAAYRVTCVANHLGGYGSGHYTATCRVGCPATGPFYYFDDSCVERLGSQQPVGANAYVVFLTRSGPSQAISEAIPRQTITAPQNWPHMASERNSILHSMLRARRKEDVLLQGWLNKRGPAADFKWARRWCVLHPDRLSYFADEEQKVKKGEIPLLNTGMCVPFNSRNAPGDSVKHKAQFPCGFVLDSNPAAGRQRQLFYFDAEDKASLDRWTSALSQASRARIETLDSFLEPLDMCEEKL